MDRVFKALADPSRRRLLDRLRENNGQTLGELCEHVDMTRQGAAKHLALLEEANLVVAIRRGREKLHYLNPVPIGEIAERWIDKFERRRLRALHDLKRELEREHDKAAVRVRDLHRHHSGTAVERADRR
jgi:DNA-binding transcriptional ArsR family regulator